jgi:hypothetical protein
MISIRIHPDRCGLMEWQSPAIHGDQDTNIFQNSTGVTHVLR